jgi:hypothetical protein
MPALPKLNAKARPEQTGGIAGSSSIRSGPVRCRSTALSIADLCSITCANRQARSTALKEGWVDTYIVAMVNTSTIVTLKLRRAGPVLVCKKCLGRIDGGGKFKRRPRPSQSLHPMPPILPVKREWRAAVLEAANETAGHGR